MSKTGERDEDLVEAARPAASHAPGRGTTTARLFPGALLRKARAARDANGVAPGAGDAVARASSSGGTPLPGDVRGRFEQSLGADLSGVRVHTGGASEDAASAVGARAYTTGSDIHFGAGQYAPADPFGLHLLAHEVAHTHQQGGAQVSRGVGADGWNDQYKSPGSGNLDAHSGSYDNYKKFLASTGETRATSGVGGHKIEGDVTSAELLEIFPGIADDQQNGKVTQDQIDAMLGELNGAFRTMKIDTVEAQASYFGNAFCESNQFRNMTETALSDQDKYQTEPSKLHLDDGWLDDAAAGKKKDVAGYQQGGKIHAQNGEGWDKSFIGRGATQVTFRDYYIQCIAILEKRAAELDKEDPDGDDTKAIHDAITNIKADPAQAGNPKYAFLFSAAHLKMPINQQGTTADESVTKGASGTSYMGPQTSTLPLKEQANRHATEVLMRRAQHQAEQAQQGDPPAATDSAEAVPGGVAEKVQRAADPGAAADTGAASGLDVSHPGDAAEVEADRMADAMVAGAPSAGASASASGVSRAPDPAAGAADASGDAAAIVACADKERAQEPPVPAETTLRGAEIASRLLSGYLPELAATWWVSGTAGSASVTGVKLEPQDGKNVSVTIGRDFILRTEQATLGERAEELRAAFRALESARAKQLLSPDQLAEASKRNEERVKRQEVSYNELQFAVGAPLTFPRGIAQNGVTGASQQGQTWADALGPASLAIAEKQQALGLAVDGKAEDATLQALGFVKNGKHWARAKAPDWKAVDAAESQTVADQKATAQKVGADTNESVDGRRSSIVSFARQQIGTVDASDRGDGKKYGNVRVVDIYRTLGLLKDGDTSKRGDLEAANKVANDTYGANLAARDKAVHDPDHDHDPKPKPLSHDEQSQLAIYQQTGKVGDWSWCGLFAVYCVKAATGVGGWTGNGATGYAAFSTGGDLEKFKQANPQPGDVLHIISHNQHHALLAEPPGADGMGPLSTVEGNVEAQGIRESQRFTFANVDIVYKPFK